MVFGFITPILAWLLPILGQIAMWVGVAFVSWYVVDKVILPKVEEDTTPGKEDYLAKIEEWLKKNQIIVIIIVGIAILYYMEVI